MELTDFLECNWKLCDISKPLLHYKFWTEVLLYWCELTFIDDANDVELIKDMFYYILV